MPKGLWYILRGKLAVPADSLMEWATWMERHHQDRVIRQEQIGPYYVSTVFLGLDHQFGQGLPILFETMIFAGGRPGMDLWMDRCGSWQEAIEMHEKAVAQAAVWTRQLPVVITKE